MRLRPDQLDSTLEKKGLVSVYYVSGDEPLQMLESADQLRIHARKNGFDERNVLTVEKGFDWNQLREVGANLSLFTSKRLIELRLGSQKPGREGGAALIEYCENINPDNILLITGNKIDKQTQNTKWFKALDSSGIVIQVWPVEASKLSGWIANRARNLNKSISHDAASLIADKVEGNLLAARQEIEKISLLVEKDEIDVRDIMDTVSDSARFDVFTLIELTMQGKTEQIIRMLRGLKSEGIEPISIFGALMWEFRRICSISSAVENGIPVESVFAQYRIWPQRKPAIQTLLRRMDQKKLSQLLRQANIIDRAMKGAIKADPWEMLENFMFRIAGIRLQSLPETD